MWLCEGKLKVKTAHFRLPSASQKRACLSSLIRTNTAFFHPLFHPSGMERDRSVPSRSIRREKIFEPKPRNFGWMYRAPRTLEHFSHPIFLREKIRGPRALQTPSVRLQETTTTRTKTIIRSKHEELCRWCYSSNVSFTTPSRAGLMTL